MNRVGPFLSFRFFVRLDLDLLTVAVSDLRKQKFPSKSGLYRTAACVSLLKKVVFISPIRSLFPLTSVVSLGTEDCCPGRDLCSLLTSFKRHGLLFVLLRVPTKKPFNKRKFSAVPDVFPGLTLISLSCGVWRRRRSV